MAYTDVRDSSSSHWFTLNATVLNNECLIPLVPQLPLLRSAQEWSFMLHIAWIMLQPAEPNQMLSDHHIIDQHINFIFFNKSSHWFTQANSSILEYCYCVNIVNLCRSCPLQGLIQSHPSCSTLQGSCSSQPNQTKRYLPITSLINIASMLAIPLDAWCCIFASHGQRYRYTYNRKSRTE